MPPLKGSTAIPLALFAGLAVNLPAQSVPPGISPACQDVDFLPQEIFTRAALNKLYSTSLPFPILYSSTYNRTEDEKYNLFLDNQGNVYIEDVINTPGQYVLLMGSLVTAGDYITVTTADPGGSGLVRAWFSSFSGQANGIKRGGSDIPTYYDGINFTRVTQDGPAGNITVTENIANIGINYINQPSLIGPNANAANVSMTGTTINFFQNTTGIYTGVGPQVNPNPYINGTSLILNQPINNFPAVGYYSGSASTGGRTSPVSQQQIDSYGNWTSDTSFPETAQGGAQGYGFDCNIQGTFVIAAAGTYTFHIQADDSWILYLGAGATYLYGPQIGTAPSQSSCNYIASRLTRAKTPEAVDSVVVSFSAPGAYAFEIGYGNWKGSTCSYFMATYDNGNVATSPTINNGPIAIGSAILPYSSGSGVTLTEDGNNVTAILPTQHPFGVNDYALLQNFTPTQYNGLVQITSVPDKKTFTFESNYSGLVTGVGGTVSPVTATCVTTAPHNLILNDQITISNNTKNLYCTTTSITTANVTITNPGLWSVSGIVDPYTFQFQTIENVGATGTGGFIGGGGLISPGIHQVCCSFLLDDGSITAPGPISQFNSTGYKKITCHNLPLGPPNTKGRILNFTGSGGASFFNIPTTPLGQQNLFGGQTSRVPIGTSTYINDNTTTSVTLDFSDATLFGAIGADITGNNLFNQVTLAPSIGCIEYADRMVWWGEVNKIQNFLNMGFNGGYDAIYSPLGWTVGDSNNSTLAYDSLQGLSYCITGNSNVVTQGILTQSAYQDSFNVPILSPNTLYRFRAKVSPTLLQYYSSTSAAWNYAYITSQNFTGTIDTNQWAKIDPYSNISINGTKGLTFTGGNGNSGVSYYFNNYIMEVPITTTPGFSTNVANITVSSNTYIPTSNSAVAYTSATGTTSPVTHYAYSNIGGWPNIATSNINSFTLNFNLDTLISTSGVGYGEVDINISFDNGVTYPQTITYTSDSINANYSVPISNIGSKCAYLNSLKIQVESIATYAPSYGSEGELVSTRGSISNISGVASIQNTTYNTVYNSGNLSLSGINLSDTSSGNLLTLYSGNVSPANVLIGFNVQPDIANSNIKIYTNNAGTETLLTSINQNTNFGLNITATPTANSTTIINFSAGSAQSNITLPSAALLGNTYTLVVADV